MGGQWGAQGVQVLVGQSIGGSDGGVLLTDCSVPCGRTLATDRRYCNERYI